MGETVEHLGAVMTAVGLPRLASRVFAQLMVDDDGRMTAAELCQALSVSAAAVSGAVSYLAQVHMIRREREPGSRRDVYVVRDDAWVDAMQTSNRGVPMLLAAMAEGQAAVGGAQTRAGRRFAISIAFLEFLEEMTVEIDERWRSRRAELFGAVDED